MWLLFARARPPDAPYWPGRRLLAVIDAVAWPGLTWFVLDQFDAVGGLFIAWLKTLLVLSTARRLRVALLMNHRYQFNTWQWGWTFARMLMIAMLLRHLI